MERVIAFVPARGGSTSIPLKNVKEINGRPLIYWTLSALQATPAVDEIIVATDHERIRAAAQSFGFSKLRVYARDAVNAQDSSSTEGVMLEYLQRHPPAEETIFILAQATSPLTQARHVAAALEQFRGGTADSLVSCCRFKRFLWTADGRPLNYDFRQRPRRQDFAGLLLENGALYINRAGRIVRDRCRLSGTVAIFEMEEYTAVELDEPDDWPIVEDLLRKYRVSATA
ncbi:MAG: acylneuraminate cytidylyltransferase family protein [Candidatus Omnitrophica bacterium]|nr:acylneuraminate cytidylyltransferase family protein [Candidatus Omnitrophota bacterium]